MRRLTISSFVAAAFAASCANDEGPRLRLDLTTGGEEGALTRAPAPTNAEVDAESREGIVKSLHRGGVAPSVDLGPVTRGTLLTLRYRAKDDAGKTLLFGASQLLEVDEPGDEAHVTMFVQRVGELARFPGSLALTDPSPLVDRLGKRYVVVAAGTRAELFDLGSFTSKTFDLPYAPKTIVATDQGLVVVDDTRGDLVDLSGHAKPLSAPAGASFGDVAGGAVVDGAAGASFVVGATRDRASDVVMRVGPDASLSFVRANTARSGAAAAFVSGRGVAIIGGHETASAIEIVADKAATPLPFAPVATRFAAAAALDDKRIVLVGRAEPARIFDLDCTGTCLPAPWSVDTPAIAGTPEVVRVADDAVLVLAPNGSGASTATVVRASGPPADVPLKIARTGARLAGPPASSADGVLVVGGAREIESYVHSAK